MTQAFPEFGCAISCACGHSEDMGAFFVTAGGTNLPDGQYQCRGCGRAWVMRARGPGQHLEGGLYIPPDVEAVEVEAVP